MECNIRNLHENDFSAIHALVQQVHTLHVTNRPDIYQDVDPLGRDYFNFILNDENTTVIVAESDNEVIGFCILTLKKPSNNPLVKPRKILFMENLCVHKNFRNLGIGKMLYLEAYTRAKLLQADSLELSVWSFNESAIEFYKAMGMKVKILTMETKI